MHDDDDDDDNDEGERYLSEMDCRPIEYTKTVAE
jgi:hypothetical protein